MTAAKGLEGITIENSEICKIDGGAGRLVYRGYDIHDLTSSLSFNRIRDGQEPIEPREDLSHAANHLYMLSGRDPDAVKVDALNKYLILLADHGKNPSTFTARFVAST